MFRLLPRTVLAAWLTFGLTALWPVAYLQAASWVANGVAGTGSCTNVSTCTAQLTSVASGELIAVWVQHEGADTTITVCTDGATCAGGNALTAGTENAHTNSDLYGTWYYFLSSTQTGTVTYTMTLAATRPGIRMIAKRYSYTGTASLDVEKAGINTSATSHTSGNFTTTGTDELMLADYTDYSGEALTANSWDIGGVDADGTETLGNNRTWWRIVSATQSAIAATGATALGATSLLTVITFKASGAGGGPPRKLPLLGIGPEECTGSC